MLVEGAFTQQVTAEHCPSGHGQLRALATFGQCWTQFDSSDYNRRTVASADMRQTFPQPSLPREIALTPCKPHTDYANRKYPQIS